MKIYIAGPMTGYENYNRPMFNAVAQQMLSGGHVALNPATPLETVRYILPKVDMLLIMTVNPGFGGQKLIPYTLDKVREARNLVKQSGCKTDIEVDGGINLENVEEAMDAGANIIVAGSAVFKEEIEKNVEAFLEKLQRQG